MIFGPVIFASIKICWNGAWAHEFSSVGAVGVSDVKLIWFEVYVLGVIVVANFDIVRVAPFGFSLPFVQTTTIEVNLHIFSL